MSGSRRIPRVYTVPAGQPFLGNLARAVIESGFPLELGRPPAPLELAKWTILLPNRRSVRELISEFASAGTDRARILPRIRALGDVDEEQILLESEFDDLVDLTLPPAISPSGVCFILARLIREWAQGHENTELAGAVMGAPGRLFAFARSLARLVDSFAIEEVGLETLERLAGGEFAGHREALLEFLSIVHRRLPEELDRRGLMGKAERRSALLRQEAARLEAGGASAPILAAGSTGSIPATANLLRVIARLEGGAVVLPGLDVTMDEESWKAVAGEPSHPQFGLQRLLAILGVTRDLVTLLPGCEGDKLNDARNWLASEIMRPTETTDLWHRALATEKSRIANAMAGVEVICASDQREEARIIALLMRESLETPEVTASLVTPDRRLARRVSAELRRWKIEVTDTAGRSLSHSPEGGLLRLILDLCRSRVGSVELAALLKHPLVSFGLERAQMERLTARLEIAALRGFTEPSGLEGLKSRLAKVRIAAEQAMNEGEPRHLHPSILRFTDEDWRLLGQFVDRFVARLEPFMKVFEATSPQELAALANAHLAMADVLATDHKGENPLWLSEAGKVLSAALSAVLEHAQDAPSLLPLDYSALIESELREWPVRPLREPHPRLRILGLLEARLVRSDLTILGGLNYGIWPSEPDIDPWLSRPMKVELGLDVPERRIGLSAHDFVQSFAAGRVVLTHSRKIDGRPIAPSRWVLRLESLLDEGATKDLVQAARARTALASALLEPAPLIRLAPPTPTPPVSARPRRLSVTRIERLIINPYQIYAENILGLRPLHPLAAPPRAADRGNLIHEALRRFGNIALLVKKDSVELLLKCGRDVFEPYFGDPQVAGFWWKRFERIAPWFIAHELDLQHGIHERIHECEAAIAIDIEGVEFTISARADRIDRLKTDTLRIIDYKTGSLPTSLNVLTGLNPQLPLEAWLAERGKFAGINGSPVSELLYVRLTGGSPPGEVRAGHGKVSPASLAKSAGEGLVRLLADYASPETPYLALGVRQQIAETGGIDHLARTREWLLNAAEVAV